jgi:hypothetical protein
MENDLNPDAARVYVTARLRLVHATAQAMTDADVLWWRRRLAELDRTRLRRLRPHKWGKGRVL